jgi:hypothetical protein
MVESVEQVKPLIEIDLRPGIRGGDGEAVIAEPGMQVLCRRGQGLVRVLMRNACSLSLSAYGHGLGGTEYPILPIHQGHINKETMEGRHQGPDA